MTAACRGGDSFDCWGTLPGVLDVASAAPMSLLAAEVRQVALTSHHACALLADGTLRCVGANAFGQLGDGGTSPPEMPATPTITDVVQVATGWAHSCALRRNGEVWCWGVNTFGELGVGDRDPHPTPTRVPSLEGIVELEAAAFTTCARRFDGDVLCWGYGGVGGEAVDSELPIVVLRGASKIALGGEAASFTPYPVIGCAEVSGEWRCWGADAAGARGTAESTPSPLPRLPRARDVSPSNGRSCGVTDDGTIHCWGREMDGALGTNVGSGAITSAIVPEIEDAISVDCGRSHCCAERIDRITCWGHPTRLGLGDGLRRDGTAAEPVARLNDVTHLSVGLAHSCAIEAGDLHCWGTSSFGALGIGDVFPRYEPEPIARFVDVDVSRHRSCARDADGAVFCWGQGRAGDTDETSSARSPRPVDARDMGETISLAVGERFACALDRDHSAWCWGDGSLTCGAGGILCPTPHRVMGPPAFDELDTGTSHACGRVGGRVWCWGQGGSGRLGTSGDSNVAVEVAGITDAVQLALGHQSTCVRRATGAVVCFGEGSSGELGAGDGLDHTTPVEVVGLLDATDLVCDRGCFARSASRGWLAWGEGNADRMGVGATADALAPVEAAHGIDFEAIALGSDSACGRLATGGVLCWGGTGASSAVRMLGLSIFGDVVD